MPNLQVQNIRVRSFSLDLLEVTWEIEDTYTDPLDFNFYILRSESPMGPWDQVAGPFTDRFRFVDNDVNLLNRWRQYYYKIKTVQITDTDNVVETDPVTQHGEPDLIAKEIQRQERILWDEFAGRRCYLFPRRTFGALCESCFDGPGKGKGHTNQKLRSNCITCFGTNYVRGYLNPIEIFIQIDPNPKSQMQLSMSERQQSDTTARLPNFPLVKPKDIIIEAENRRWKVIQVNQTERLRSVVHQELAIHELVKGDIEFQLPINLKEALKDLEPSAPRNFTNPQNLESFEEESLASAKAVYGYPKI